MGGWVDGWVGGWVGGWVDGWMGGWVGGLVAYTSGTHISAGAWLQLLASAAWRGPPPESYWPQACQRSMPSAMASLCKPNKLFILIVLRNCMTIW